MDIKKTYFNVIANNIEIIADKQADKLHSISQLIYECMKNNGVVQLFGCRYGQEFVNELNFRAGGIAPYHSMNVNDLMLRGIAAPELIKSYEIFNHPEYLDKLLGCYQLDERDMIIIVSYKGNEPLIVAMAKHYHDNGQKVIGVINGYDYNHSDALPDGTKLLDYCDDYFDLDTQNKPDLAVEVNGQGVGQITSTVGNVLAQMLTADLYDVYKEHGENAPVLLSANLKDADKHNNALTGIYERRVR